MPRFSKEDSSKGSNRRSGKTARPKLFRPSGKRHCRPEDVHLAKDFYGNGEGDSHGQKNAIRNIQGKITIRGLELLAISPPAKILDAGCGSGFSSIVAQAAGFDVKGFDIDKKMVDTAKQNGVDAKLGNMTKMPFEDRTFDAAISISALQWLAAGKGSKAAFDEYYQSAKEFARVLKPAGRAVIQFYPQNEDEAFNAGKAFRKAGFAVTLQIDSANNPKKRKIFLVLSLQHS